ncbi:hypothetical protein OPV22_026566 [Ensete ventricosum]|uniref:Ubiquitin-like protease family profile domain-containing protein n=1 Tax=Ensete ventricosum TaxID=4639 RepID=A0AAX5ND60_ENSVE|nr:hypothetical protein OPV22_035179 [Ensete ventricosum]KAJ8472223.1 hypothetical protein OPV22_026566 [Ensete ventricosum]
MAPPKNKGDEKILSYLDVVMRRSDLGILRGPHYLNDRIIEFCFAHLASLPPPRAPSSSRPPSPSGSPTAPTPSPSASPPTPSASPIGTSSSSPSTATSTSPSPGANPAEAASSTAGRPASSCTTTAAAASIGVTRSGFSTPSAGSSMMAASPRGSLRGSRRSRPTNGYDCGLFVMAIAKVVYDWYVARGVLRLILTLMEPK